jgi:hypothetical protein
LPGAADSFTVGIENDPLTGGSRLLEWAGGSVTITNSSGASRNITNNWVCVSGNYGIAAGPAGYFRYQAASGYNRSGAAEDTLRFSPQAPLSPRYAVWFPGEDAIQTAALAAQVNWSIQGDTVVLSFPGLGGVTSQIEASVSEGQPAYPPYVLPVAGIIASSSQSSYPPGLACDQSTDTFWVSSGTAPGQGPRPTKPEWLKVNFPRQCAISGFQMHPRTYNGGYGPKQIRMIFDGATIFEGEALPTAALNVEFSSPVNATNAMMYITSSYDPAYPTNSRNVQVVELVFTERAQPGTYGDWAVRHLGGLLTTDPESGDEAADLDYDGVPNLTEFAMGGDPLIADAQQAALRNPVCDAETFSFTFNQRTNLSAIQRKFERSTDLAIWTEIQPLQVRGTGSGPIQLHEAIFPRAPGTSYLRVRFEVTP